MIHALVMTLLKFNPALVFSFFNPGLTLCLAGPQISVSDYLPQPPRVSKMVAVGQHPSKGDSRRAGWWHTYDFRQLGSTTCIHQQQSHKKSTTSREEEQGCSEGRRGSTWCMGGTRGGWVGEWVGGASIIHEQ